MNRPRLMQMAELLREVIAGTWRASVMPPVDKEDDHEPEDLPKVLGEVHTHFALETFLATSGAPIDCGYAACALGHACLDQRFVSQGLHFDQDSIVTVEVPVEADEPDGLEYFDAAAFFFDIAVEDSEWLFCNSDGYETAKDVLERLEAYMRGEAAPEIRDDDNADE